MSRPLDDAFSLLDLDPDASLTDAKKARRELALIWHPDRFPESEALRRRAEEKLKRINGAYEEIADYLRAMAPRRALNATPEAATASAGDARKTVVLRRVPVKDGALGQSLGLAAGGDRFAEVLSAGTTVPCAAAKTFTNARDFQSELRVHVKRGASGEPASHADGLGRVTFVDLPPGPRGFVRMQVVFAIDEEGTVAIGGTDLDSGEPILVTTR